MRSTTITSILALAASASATFHIIAQNKADASGTVLENETQFFVIGSDDDTLDNKCSNSADWQNLDGDASCDQGLCLINNFPSFDLNNICGLPSGIQFIKATDGSGSYETKNNNNYLGTCNKADQVPALCQSEILGGSKFTFGSVTDLLFCDLDNVPRFCDPAS